MQEIYLAGGCFWGVEQYFSQIEGIEKTSVGYANGNSEITTYELLKVTQHAETIHIQYNNSITLRQILLHYFRIIDPTSINQQGNDKGIQYRTGIYYTNPKDINTIKQVIKEIESLYDIKVVVEIEELKHYILAEDYHQNYLKKNPNGYCHIDQNIAKQPLIDIQNYQNKTTDHLTTLQYEVTQNAATELPFDNEYNKHFEEGIYVDIVTGEPLFFSKDKFDSGCGWPAFSKGINNEVMKYYRDHSHDMERIEVKSRGNSHLGHVFNDGPKDKGELRYCINSASLRFIPKDKMQEEGYGYLLQYV